MSDILSSLNFSGLDLSGMSLRNLVLANCRLDRANLERCDFTNTQFFQCSFERASFERSTFYEATFSGERFENGSVSTKIARLDEFIELLKRNDNDLNNTIIDEKKKYFEEMWDKILHNNGMQVTKENTKYSGVKTSFKRANLFGSKFDGYELSDCDFSDANLEEASFKKCALSHSLFSGTFFKKNGNQVFGYDCSLDFADFRGTNLNGINFRYCETLEAADFSDADLRDARFVGSHEKPMNLYRANFNNARLRDVNFKHCNVRAATFVRSDLSGAIFDGTKESANAIAADFTGANLQGAVIKEKLNFISSNFSGAYLSWSQSTKKEPEKNEPKKGIYRATIFNKDVNLCDSIFSGAYLRGTILDDVNVTNASFAGATFGDTSNNGNTSGNKKFKNTTFTNVDFRDVDLGGYIFDGCALSNACFEGSNLNGAAFINSESLEHAQFIRAKLKETKFIRNGSNPNVPIKMQACGFENSDLAGAIFHDCNLEWAWFNESKLQDCKFQRCDLRSVVFKGVEFSSMKICEVKRADHCLFKSSKGKEANFDLSLPELDDEGPHYAITFVDTIFEHGRLQGCFLGATLDHSKLVLTNNGPNSEIEWQRSEFKTSSVNFKGEMTISAGLVDNSLIVINGSDGENSNQLVVDNSEVRSSAIEGIGEGCKFNETAFNGSSLKGDLKEIYVNKCLFEATTLGKDGDFFNNLKKLGDISRYCSETLGSIKSNYKGIGDYKHEDLFFGLENDKRIEESERGGVKVIYIGFLLALVFFLVPLMSYLELSISGREKNLAHIFYSLFLSFSTSSILISLCRYKGKEFSNIVPLVGIFSVILFIPVFCILQASQDWLLYASSIMSLAASILMFSRVPLNFLNCLSRYGTNMKRFAGRVGAVWGGFAFSYYWFFAQNHILNFSHTSAKALYTSASAFFALGFWGHIQPEKYPIRMYINIESAVGVVMLAVLVATIVRKTMGR